MRVTARKFADLKTAPLGVEIAKLEPVEKSVRAMQGEEGEISPTALGIGCKAARGPGCAAVVAVADNGVGVMAGGQQ